MKNLFFCCLFLVTCCAIQAQSNTDLINQMQNQLSRVAPGTRIQLEEVEVSRDNYSFTLTGKGTFGSIQHVSFTSYFNKAGALNYFKAELPPNQQPGLTNLDALFQSGNFQNLFLPVALANQLQFGSYIFEVNTTNNQVSVLNLNLRLLGNLTILDDLDAVFQEITIGYKLENPLSNPKRPKGVLSGKMDLLGTTLSISSNLTPKLENWTITGEALNLDIPLASWIKKMNIPEAVPDVPRYFASLNISKLNIELTPLSGLNITAWTNLGNCHFVVQRGEKEVEEEVLPPLSTQLTGGYNGQQATSTTRRVKKADYRFMLGYTLPENLAFTGDLAFLNSLGLNNAGIVVSTLKKATDSSLPLFAGVGRGNITIEQGITLIGLIDFDRLKEAPFIRKYLEQSGIPVPTKNVLLRGTIPMNTPNELSAEVMINFSDVMNIAKRVYFKSTSLQIKPFSSSPTVSVKGRMDVVLSNPDKPLEFYGGITAQPATLTGSLAGQMNNTLSLPNPFGFPKVRFSNLAFSAGLSFMTDIPTPDNMFLSGQMSVDQIVGRATIGFDYNQISNNMYIGRFCNLNFNDLINGFCQAPIQEKIPAHVRTWINKESHLDDVYFKLIPPGAVPIFIGGIPKNEGVEKYCPEHPYIQSNDYSPGLRMNAKGVILGWNGNFYFSFEGDMSGLSAGLTAFGDMDPLKVPYKINGTIPIFELTGSGGRGRPEFSIDLSTRHLINRISGQWSPQLSNNTPALPAGVPVFIQARHSGKVIDVAGGSTQMEASIQQSGLNYSGAQQFILEPVKDGWYSIKNVNSNMYLDVHMGLANPGRKIWQYLGNKTPAQLFKPVPTDQGFFVLQSNLHPSLALEIKDAGKQNGAILQTNTVNQAYQQQFRFLPVAQDPEKDAQQFSQDKLVYGNGKLSILGITADVYLDLTINGFRTQMSGRLLQFLESDLDATVQSFANPMANTFINGRVKQEVVKNIEGLAANEIKRIFGKEIEKAFADASKKALIINEITFGGRLDGMQSGVELIVKYSVAGKNDQVAVTTSVSTVANLAKQIAGQMANISKSKFESLKEVIIVVTQPVTNTGREVVDKGGEVADKGGEVTDDAKDKGNSVKDDALEFFGKSAESIANFFEGGWKTVSSAISDFFGGGSSSKKLKVSGSSFYIESRIPNYYLQSSFNSDGPANIYADFNRRGLMDQWQFIPAEKDHPGKFYIVSAMNGLNLHVQSSSTAPGAPIHLQRHDSDNRANERYALEPVNNEPGWYYFKNEKSGLYAGLNMHPASAKYNLTPGEVYFLVAKNSNLILRMEDGDIEQSFEGDNPGGDRTWYMRPAGTPDVYYIAKHNNKDNFVMQVKDGKAEAGKRIIRKPINYKQEQQFRFERQADGSYQLISLLNPNLCMEVKNGSTDNHAEIQLGIRRNVSYQQFWVVPVNRARIYQTNNLGDLSKFKMVKAPNVTWQGR